MYEEFVLVIHLIFKVSAKLNQKDLSLRYWQIPSPCICYCSLTLVLPQTFYHDKVIENMCWVFFLSSFVQQLCFFGIFQAIGQLSSLFTFLKQHTKHSQT